MTKIQNLRITPKDVLEEIIEKAEKLKNVVVIAQGKDGTAVLYNDIDFKELLVLARIFQVEMDDLIREEMMGG